MESNSNIGFVIRAKNEELWIGHAIQSVIDHFGPKTEIVVLDSGSTDDTLSVVEMFTNRFYNVNIHTIAHSRYTPGHAINRSIEYLSKEVSIVGILSSHCKITKADQHMLHEHFADQTVFGVMGRQIPVYRGKKIVPRYIWSNFGVELAVNPIEKIDGEERPFFHNAFSFIRFDDWKKRPFPEDLTGKEDRYWAKDFVDEGRKFVLDSRFSCEHYWTPNGATWKGIG